MLFTISGSPNKPKHLFFNSISHANVVPEIRYANKRNGHTVVDFIICFIKDRDKKGHHWREEPWVLSRMKRTHFALQIVLQTLRLRSLANVNLKLRAISEIKDAVIAIEGPANDTLSEVKWTQTCFPHFSFVCHKNVSNVSIGSWNLEVIITKQTEDIEKPSRVETLQNAPCRVSSLYIIWVLGVR